MTRGRAGKTELLIREAAGILESEHPMTLRQLFYRLVSKLILENSRASYQKLSRVMGEARNNGEISFEYIVDRSKPEYIPNVWDDPEKYIETVAKAYRRDRWKDQPYYIEVWLEKDSLTGSVEGICQYYGVPLIAHRGYSSVTKKHELAEHFFDVDKPVVVFYIGDYDPSGLDIERDIKEKIRGYGFYEFTIQRLAILGEDIEKFDLPPLRIKLSDPRAKRFKARYGSDVVEADALPP